MNRRDLFRLVPAALLAPVLINEALAEALAPRRTIFLPPRGGWDVARDGGYTYAWRWVRGGEDIEIVSPTLCCTGFLPRRLGSCNGIAELCVTDSLGRQAPSHQVDVYLERDSLYRAVKYNLRFL